MKKLFYILLIITSCSKPIELELDSIEPVLVVNSIIATEQDIEVFVSTTQSLSEINIENLNSKIELFEDNVFIATLQKNINGGYTTNYNLQTQKQYKIEVTDLNYTTCIAIDTIPEKVLIESATLLVPVGFNEFNEPYFEATISFSDPQEILNYYEIILYSKDDNISRQYITEIETSNITIINEGDQAYYPNSLFFSDILFNGRIFEIKVKFIAGSSRTIDGEYLPLSDLYVILRSTSRSYYLYRKYWTRHSYNQTLSEDIIGTLFNGEPIEAYSNIENGLGIFVGYNQDTVKFTVE